MSLPPASDAFSKGFGAGIQVWLFFLLAFYALRYPVPLSIMLGAMAGVAAGFIVGWWDGKPAPVLPEEETEDASLEEVAQTRQRRRRYYARMRNARNKPEVKWDWNTVKDTMAFWKRS